MSLDCGFDPSGADWTIGLEEMFIEQISYRWMSGMRWKRLEWTIGQSKV